MTCLLEILLLHQSNNDNGNGSGNDNYDLFCKKPQVHCAALHCTAPASFASPARCYILHFPAPRSQGLSSREENAKRTAIRKWHNMMTRCEYGIERCIVEIPSWWMDSPHSRSRSRVFWYSVWDNAGESWMEKVISDGIAHHIVSFSKCSI